jgi:hypothetical protein
METVTIELARDDHTAAVAEYVVRRGLSARVEGPRIEVRRADDALLRETRAAVETWLAEHPEPVVIERAGERLLVVRPEAE